MIKPSPQARRPTSRVGYNAEVLLNCLQYGNSLLCTLHMSVPSDFGRLHWDVSCDFDEEEGEGWGRGGGSGACYGPSLFRFCILDASGRL